MEENAAVKKRLDEVEQANAGLRTENAGLRTENAAVKNRLDEVEQANAELRTENSHMKQRLEKVEQVRFAACSLSHTPRTKLIC